MTDADLQLAIDKTAVLAMSSPGGSTLRELAQRHVQELFRVQAVRAGLLHAPGVRPGAIQEVVK